MKDKSIRRISLFIALLVAAAVTVAELRAQNVTDAQAKERIDYIQNVLDDGQKGAQAWWYGWICAYSVGTMVQGSLGYVHKDDFYREKYTYRKISDQAFSQDMMIGSVTTLLGVAGMFIDPFTPAYAPDMLRKMPENTPGERQAKLLRAEELLRRCAKREKDGWGWFTHVLNIVVNIGAGLVTSLAYERPWTDGLINFGIGEAISLVNIFTQPRRAIKDLKKYEAKYIDKTGYHDEYDAEWFISIKITSDQPVGLMVGIKF